MFGSEPKLSAELRAPSRRAPDPNAVSESIWNKHQQLSEVFETVREHLDTAHKTSKENYDLGTTKRMFSIGQEVKIKLKNVGKQLNKLQSPWSEALTIQSINGPVLELISKSG